MNVRSILVWSFETLRLWHKIFVRSGVLKIDNHQVQKQILIEKC